MYFVLYQVYLPHPNFLGLGVQNLWFKTSKLGLVDSLYRADNKMLYLSWISTVCIIRFMVSWSILGSFHRNSYWGLWRMLLTTVKTMNETAERSLGVSEYKKLKIACQRFLSPNIHVFLPSAERGEGNVTEWPRRKSRHCTPSIKYAFLLHSTMVTDICLRLFDAIFENHRLQVR